MERILLCLLEEHSWDFPAWKCLYSMETYLIDDLAEFKITVLFFPKNLHLHLWEWRKDCHLPARSRGGHLSVLLFILQNVNPGSYFPPRPPSTCMVSALLLPIPDSWFLIPESSFCETTSLLPLACPWTDSWISASSTLSVLPSQLGFLHMHFPFWKSWTFLICCFFFSL